MVNAGRILIIGRGDWSNLENYEQLDLVLRGNFSYLARQASVGVDPETDTQMVYWQPFAKTVPIANTETPGIVMPDGRTITIDTQTGLIAANLGISDITDVVITSLTGNQILRYDATTQKWVNYSISDIQSPIEAMIAPIENGATTSKAYAAGEKFIRANVLYEAKVSIAQGASFASLALNTDYEVSDDLSAEIKAVSSQAYNENDPTLTDVASDDLLPIYDTSAATKKKIAVNNFIGGLVSNPNLLDNPFFTVNQRGESTYTGNIYTVDRWKFNGNNNEHMIATVSDNGITIEHTSVDENVGYFVQYLEWERLAPSVGKSVTLSILLSDGTLASGSAVLPQATSSSARIIEFMVGGFLASFTVKLTASGNSFVQIQKSVSGSITVRAVKLELGSVSTLAMDTAPNYATELLKCQRYYQRFIFAGQGRNIGTSFVNANKTAIWTYLSLATAMRSTPTLGHSALSTFSILSADSWYSAQTPTAMQIHDVEGCNCQLTWTVSNDFTAGINAVAQSTEAAYIDFSADL